MLIDSNQFLFSQTLTDMCADSVMSILQKWPDLQTKNHRKTLMMSLARRLFNALGMVFTVELNQSKSNGKLTGDNSKTRYQRFDWSLSRKEERQKMFESYEVLPALIDVIKRNWEYQCQLLFNRLKLDSKCLMREFGISSDICNIVSIQSDCSDLHEHGRSVSVIQFKHGKKLVYKPRSFEIDIRFKEYIEHLNSDLGWEAIKVPYSVDRGLYGWQEFIAQQSCISSEDVENYYRRQGVNLALVYLLGGVDFHVENIIAHGSFPVLIDLETIVQPVLEGNHSLIRTGMVPVHGRSFDYSALGFNPKAANMIKQNVWIDSGKDTVRLKPQWVPYTGRHCTPMLNGEPSLAHEHIKSVICQFKSALKVLSHSFQKSRFVNNFLYEMTIRYIHRTTQVYHEILTASFHPINLKNIRKRKAFIRDQLKRFAIDSPLELLDHEVSVLETGCLPTCYANTSSTDLLFGDDSIKNFFKETAKVQIMERVTQCNNIDSLMLDLHKRLT